MTEASLPRRILVLVDGEHYPPVIDAAIAEISTDEDEVVAAANLGGSEKLRDGLSLSVPVVGGSDPVTALQSALSEYRPDRVYDLSDLPVLDPRLRMELASRALVAGVAYAGPDFAFEPPPRERKAVIPSIAVISTGKRTGKTAISCELARSLVAQGQNPIIVAMGRGGPSDPEIIRGSAGGRPSVEKLLEWADDGRHAASDHIEDAVMTGVTTVGTRRCGGGLAGAPGPGTFALGVELANQEARDAGHDVMIFEGSGSAIPPVDADATILVVDAGVEPDQLGGYMGPYRLLLADQVAITMGQDAIEGGQAASRVVEIVHEIAPATPLTRLSFRPDPAESIEGKRVVVATTAPPGAGPTLRYHLEKDCGATIEGVSHHLADRSRLVSDLEALLPGSDLLLTELKASGVDVAARMAVAMDKRVVFSQNRLHSVGGDAPIDQVSRSLFEKASTKFDAKSGG